MGDDEKKRALALGKRFMDAWMLLSVHGLLSDSETRAANKRIAKWAAKHGLEIVRDPLTRARAA